MNSKLRFLDSCSVCHLRCCCNNCARCADLANLFSGAHTIHMIHTCSCARSISFLFALHRATMSYSCTQLCSFCSQISQRLPIQGAWEAAAATACPASDPYEADLGIGCIGCIGCRNQRHQDAVQSPAHCQLPVQPRCKDGVSEGAGFGD